MRRDPGGSLLRRCPAARAASMATRRSSDAMLARNVSYVSCTSWSWARAVSAATSARSSCAGGSGDDGRPGPPPGSDPPLRPRDPRRGRGRFGRPPGGGRASRGRRAGGRRPLLRQVVRHRGFSRAALVDPGSDTPVLSLQNGVDNEDKIDEEKLGAGRAMGGVAQGLSPQSRRRASSGTTRSGASSSASSTAG